MPRTEEIIFALVAFVAIILVTLMTGAILHPLWCKKGHYETVTVSGGMQYQSAVSADGQVIQVPVWIPEHQEGRWTCEEE